ncbi:MAG: hypothetical protein FJ100_02805 [Deltaproteobacteria bacterium]|nr:hypothetical protein [Deltaproteobacteria bacterium]
MIVLPVLAGCEKARQERAARQAQAAVASAIEQYSTASAGANAAHREVLDAFAAANASTNLPDYKAALRTRVLPAMDVFVHKLEAIPTATAELKAVHGRLTEAYRRARDEIAEFERGLGDAQGLRRFDEIRTALQRAVADYRIQLADYYTRHDRQLRLDAARMAESATPTGRSPPAASTPASP